MAAKRILSTRRLVRVGLLVLLLLALPTATVFAHPLGNFTVNRYSALTLAGETAHLLYILDMAEIPTYQAMAAIDSDGDGTVNPDEKRAYAAGLGAELAAKLALTINGQQVVWQLQNSNFAFAEGQGGLQTLRLEFRYTGPISPDGPWSGEFQDENFPGKLGWQEVVVRAGDGVRLITSSVPSQDTSQELRAYPQDLLQSPLRVTAATFRAGKAGASIPQGAEPASARAPLGAARAGNTEPFADLISLPISGPNALLFALLAAFVWGGAHALSPGHGKTIVAAYLVGSRGTARHALFLGLTTTVTHTAGVFVLGLITLFASRYILPEQLYPWLGVLSGLLVVGIGGSMIWQRLRSGAGHSHHHHSSGHSHDHPHDHSHNHPHDHTHDQSHAHSHDGHSHMPPGADGAPITWRGLLALGVSGGLLPCPSALVVMLSAIALQRVAFGLLLIVVFSFGLASVLTLVGILMVHAGKLVRYVPESGRFWHLAPVASAIFITLAGGAITAQALVSTGLLGL